MANVITPTYSFTLPEVGADTNAWGGHLNGNFQTIDNQMVSRTTANAQTFAGAINLPANGLNVGSGQLQVSGGNVAMSGALTVTGAVTGGAATFPSVKVLADFARVDLYPVNAANLNAWRLISNVNGAATDGNLVIQHSNDRFATNFVSITLTPTGNVSTSTAPSTGAHLTNKTYVDGEISTVQSTLTTLITNAAPPGAVMLFAMNTAPTGWLACDGASVSRTTYAALFAAIGTTFGSASGTTFNLPDMRGYFARGSGTNSDGTASGAFGAKQADAYLNHSHGITDPTHTHGVNFLDGSYSLQTGGGGALNGSGSNRATSAAATGITVNASTTGGTETRPKNIALLYCIKT